LQVTFEEGTWAAWLYDLLKPHITEVVVCNPRKMAVRMTGSMRANWLNMYMNKIKSVYHGEHGLRTLKELARSYLTITEDLARVNRTSDLAPWYPPGGVSRCHNPSEPSIMSCV
jgi:hypothetical protein